MPPQYPEWIQIKLPVAKAFVEARLTSRSDGNLTQMPATFDVMASNNGTNWTTLATVKGAKWSSKTETLRFKFKNSDKFLYYKLNIKSNNGNSNYMSFSELDFVEEGKVVYKRHLVQIEHLIPAMTSNEQDGYIASATSEYSTGEGAWRAFDRQSNQWTTKSGINQNVELKIELPTAKSCTTILLGISNATKRMPKTFRIEASNDDLQWTVLYQDLEGSDLSLNTNYLYENPYKDVAFKYYRLFVISNRGGGHLSLRQFGLLNKTIVKEY